MNLSHYIACALSIFGLSSCQSEEKARTVEQPTPLAQKQLTFVGHNSSPIVHEGTLFFVSRKRPTHEKPEIYRFKNDKLTRLTFQNAELLPPFFYRDKIIYPSTLFQDIEQPHRLSSNKPDLVYDLISSDINIRKIKKHRLPTGTLTSLEISPDKKNFVYITTEKKEQILVIQELESQKRETLAKDIFDVTWHPDASTLFWVKRVNDEYHLVRYKQKKKLTLFKSSAPLYDLFVTQNAIYLAKPSDSGKPGIFRLSKSNLCLDPVVSQESGAIQPFVSSDEKLLYFASAAETHGHIYRLDLTDLEFSCAKKAVIGN